MKFIEWITPKLLTCQNYDDDICDFLSAKWLYIHDSLEFSFHSNVISTTTTHKITLMYPLTCCMGYLWLILWEQVTVLNSWLCGLLRFISLCYQLEWTDCLYGHGTCRPCWKHAHSAAHPAHPALSVNTSMTSTSDAPNEHQPAPL